MAQPKKVNYLNNKDILKEIHKSKMTYCYVADENYGKYDVILEDVKKINRNSIKVARENRAALIQSIGYQAAMAVHDPKDYKNKPNKELLAVMETLKVEFNKTKELIVNLSHHMDDTEKKFKMVESEIKKRNI